MTAPVSSTTSPQIKGTAIGTLRDLPQTFLLSESIEKRMTEPKVRAAAADELIVANGFSCRKQIELTNDRRALAHLLDMATRAEAGEPLPSVRPELACLPPVPRDPTWTQSLLVIAAGVATVRAIGWWCLGGSQRRAPRRRLSVPQTRARK